jgi:hypothetical protein
MSSSTNQSAETYIANGLTFTTNDIDITAPKLNKSGGKSASILYKPTKKGLYLNLQVPMLTWGASVFRDQQSGKESYDMSIQFPREDYSSPETDTLLANFQAFESLIKTEAIKNSMAWFNKKTMTPEVIDALWTPMLKYSKDKETGEPDLTKSPTLKVKLPCWDGKFNCEIYDLHGTMLYPDANSPNTPIDLITKGINVIAILQCGGLWFANGKFGCTWKLFQALIQPKPSLKGRCLIASSPMIQKAMAAQNETGLAICDDSDGEQEQEQAPAPAPIQVQTPQKKPQVVVPVAEVETEQETVQPVATTASTASTASTAAPLVVKKKVVRKKD